MSPPEIEHYSVMRREVLDWLNIQADFRILDCTTGGAGHSMEMLKRAGSQGFLWGIERDPETLIRAQKRLETLNFPFQLIPGNFADLEALASEYGMKDLDAILLDLGTSLFQLKEPQRGFSFLNDGPLDMRMNPDEAVATAADLVNQLSEAELTQIFQDFGEERMARRIARAIIAQRVKAPFLRTSELAQLVEKVMPRHGQKLHPATRVFQALRIAVNGELDALERVLPLAVDLLKPGGRLAVISFHSLEDRRVKLFMREMATNCICPPRQPICTCQHRAKIKLLTRAVKPSEQEIAENSPSRSARLRVAEKL
ncbi:16S rRNA (cytosine(1402)-N(4))-methyltransferase [bacterium (Candidatus Blackallbacteria) CG17_big_fil_post_rev_8_21_14_2_50_48_46]|uniref:Ribosomal RNA small subunit methyltransferase H n=1 Tax=bacterium (Candidatus Blackallbacteria) CG17_big_fil_post_rev_8_21_14_2_50_48_46 TaxID=2014261 RepID=A0A2M7G5F0_9BACT|nr:MAG: 16S rRNA (cytosine(1402)-N(4))-methyltransferase [bacterium (Candidatus Blackallbacteria) CG18_big_fil_WC_8_21_14_2_50_49_26]PIW17224.1 MAG: 16S rRNA (cytosine(1402)-N(4))-methyltransferase [bacterium (Candidatus Blackallbacteria) CG17_big_fil_post_rev_8_21_14_2_50_48_46]PIW51015.1 MAG: 16S rRNA (cytosine(1402)-N(4))-methyltransferase [bacterium (Candidatus Blackallbacteria) CG13_big_fil_rev_8_21_14_2_50_49_14]